jgi:hypothetical protein
MLPMSVKLTALNMWIFGLITSKYQDFKSKEDHTREIVIITLFGKKWSFTLKKKES